MSLIETALVKAKRLAEGRDDPSLRERRSRHRPPPDAEAAASRAEMARTFQAASVERAAMERHGIVLEVEDASSERSFKILRTRVLQRLSAEGWHSIAVTAAGEGDGKTVTAINLAIALAKDVNTWVFLVDLDLQHPKIAEYLGLQFTKGLSDYLLGPAGFEDIVYCPGIERLAVIPNGQAYDHSSELLSSARMQELNRALQEEQPRHIVIYDMPPMLMSDDVEKFAPSVDSMLLVVSEGTTPRSSLERAREILQGMNLLGVVLNRSSERETSGYY
jgi:capsular exopolysaccharide synthesis family protein